MNTIPHGSTKWPLMYHPMFICVCINITLFINALLVIITLLLVASDYAESVPENPAKRANIVSFLSVSIHGRWVLNCRDKTSQISITEPLQVETTRKIIQKKNMNAVEYKDDANGIKASFLVYQHLIRRRCIVSDVGCNGHTCGLV